MPLTKTTVVPPNDPQPILDNHNALKLLLIVNNSDYAQIADDLSQHPPLADRQVLWFTNGLPAAYQTQFNISNMATVVAFTLKLDNMVADIIRNTDTFNYPRISLAYYNAGL